DHGLADRVARQVAHERTVELQIVELEILETRERAHTRAEIVDGELATHAMQHADEAPGVLEVADHGALGNLEAHLPGRNAGAVEGLDHEFQELRIAERLAGNVYANAAVA